MRVEWKQKRTDDGTVIPDEYVGTVAGEPDFQLEASRWGWRVLVLGNVAEGQILTDVDVSRAVRRAQKPISRLNLSKQRAEKWVARVVEKREGDRSG